MIRACSPSLFLCRCYLLRRWLWWWFDLYRAASAQRSAGGADTVGGAARNILVVTLGSYFAVSRRDFDWRMAVPFFLSSVPMAFLGGIIPIDASIYSTSGLEPFACRSQLVCPAGA